MPHSRRFLVCAALILASSSLAHSQSPPGKAPRESPRPVRHVILVSIDGLLPGSYTEPDRHGLKVPMLRQMVREGAWSDGAVSVFPTLTYPAHTSIATGTNPAKHGIVTNEAWDPLGKNDGGWRWYAEDIRVKPLWEAARARQLRTALIWWPVTVGARGTVVVPEVWRASTEEDVKLVRALATPGIFEAVAKRFPSFLAGFAPPQPKDETLTDLAVYVLETVRPHLMMLHTANVDHEQHNHGAWSPEARAAIEEADRQLARLMEAAKRAGIWEHTALVLVSDHGFANAGQQVRPGVLLREKGLITLDDRNRIIDWKAVVLPTSGSGYLYVKDPEDLETKRILLDTFLPLAGKPGSGIGRVLTQEEIRRQGGDPQAFLAIEGAEGFRVGGAYRGDYIAPASTVATHGFYPDRADMRASLVVYGPGIASQQLTGARLMDVAPTIAQWLGLRLPEAEGSPLPVRFRKVAR